MTKSANNGGRRGLHQKVRTARKRSAASTRWLERQLNDPYVHSAKAEGYRARSAYKLIEIDDKHRILKPGASVIDLGAAPGGWAQVAVNRVKSKEEAPAVIGIDLLAMDYLPGAHFLEMDFLDDAAPDKLLEALGNRNPNIVLSDMAAATTGHRRTDHLRTVHLFEVAADFAIKTLAPGGHFLAKVFRGGTDGTLLTELKKNFARTIHIKPPASRAESPELYVLATGFRPNR